MSFIGARVYNNADIVVPKNLFWALPFNSERYDSDNIHSTASNTTRLTARTAGKYAIHGQASFFGNASGRRMLAIHLNGSSSSIGLQEWDNNGGDATQMQVSTQWHMNVDDYVELCAYQSSGYSLKIAVAANYTPEFMMALLGDGSPNGYNDIEDMDDFSGSLSAAQAGRPVIVNDAGDGFEIAGSGDPVVVYGLMIDKDME